MGVIFKDLKQREILNLKLFEIQQPPIQEITYPFEFVLKDPQITCGFLESYIGVYCSINYLVEVDCYKNYEEIGTKAKIGAKGMFFVQNIDPSPEMF